MKILKIGAVWCPGCLVMRPIWEKIEKENSWIKTEYFDYDEHKELKEKYDLDDLPVAIFLDKQGKEIARLEGEIDEENIMEVIEINKNK